MTPAFIVHGGAWDIPDHLVEAHRAACLKAVEIGWQILNQGGTALDAVVQSIVSMEDDPALDAGIGAFLNADGEVELDAGLMEGTTLKAGSVAAVQRVRHPILLAREVIKSEHVLLAGPGAERFADRHGIERCPSATLVIPRELARWSEITRTQSFDVRQAFTRSTPESSAAGHDTVGAVALDLTGSIVAGTSTGGTPHKLPGRVGDSPLVGSGYYADSELGGASCTGWGEGIMRVVLAKTAIDHLAQEDASATAQWAIDHLASRLGGLGGIILLNSSAQVGYAFNTPRMAYAYMQQHLSEPVIGI